MHTTIQATVFLYLAGGGGKILLYMESKRLTLSI